MSRLRMVWWANWINTEQSDTRHLGGIFKDTVLWNVYKLREGSTYQATRIRLPTCVVVHTKGTIGAVRRLRLSPWRTSFRDYIRTTVACHGGRPDARQRSKMKRGGWETKKGSYLISFRRQFVERSVLAIPTKTMLRRCSNRVRS